MSGLSISIPLVLALTILWFLFQDKLDHYFEKRFGSVQDGYRWIMVGGVLFAIAFGVVKTLLIIFVGVGDGASPPSAP